MAEGGGIAKRTVGAVRPRCAIYSTLDKVASARAPFARSAETRPAAAAMAASTYAVALKACCAPAAPPESPPAATKMVPVNARPSAVPIPRVMLRTPDAMPACCPGAAPMIEALLGEVNRPMPTPDRGQQDQETGGGGGEDTEERQGQGHDRHPAHGQGTGAHPVGQPSGQRRDDTEGQRHRHELEARPGVPESLTPFEIEGDQQQDAEHHEIGADAADDPRGELGVAEQPEVEHRVAVAAFVPDEQHAEHGRRHEEADDHRRAPALPRAEGDGREKRHHGGKEDAEAGPVEADPRQEVAAPGHQQDRRDGAEHPEGNIDEEDETPPTRSQEQPADGRAQGEPQRLRRALQPDGAAERSARHDQHDDGQAVRLQHGGPHRLERPEAAQRAQPRREAAQDGSEGEDDEAVDVEQLATPHVGEASDGGHGGDQDQQVREADPGDGTDRHVEGPLQRWQGDGDDGRIELAHERPDTDGGDGEPVGIPVAPG